MRCCQRQLSVIQQSFLCVSHGLCSVSLIYCCLSSYNSSNIQSSSLSKPRKKKAKTKHKGESRSRYRLCVLPCPHYIKRMGIYTVCAWSDWERSMQSRLSRGLTGGNEDGRAPIFFLSHQIQCPLSGIGSPPRSFFLPEKGLDALPVFLRGGGHGGCR